MARTGRPTKLTAAKAQAIVEHIENGNYPEVAAQAEGVDRSTYYRWMARGRDGDQPYSDFHDQVTEARARAETTAVGIVHTLATEDPRLALQWLERAHASRWAPGVRRTVGVTYERVLDEIEREFADEPTVAVRVLEAIARAEGALEAGEAPADLRVH